MRALRLALAISVALQPLLQPVLAQEAGANFYYRNVKPGGGGAATTPSQGGNGGGAPSERPLALSYTGDRTGTKGAGFSGRFSAAGEGVTYALAAGALPPGTSLDPATGVVSGTLSGAGSGSMTVRASAPGHKAATLAQAWSVAEGAAADPLRASFDGAPRLLTTGVAATIPGPTISGGTAPYTVAYDRVPGGMTAQADGSITGTPDTVEGFTLSATVTDASGGAPKAVAGPVVDVAAPVTLSFSPITYTFLRGTERSFPWSVSGGSGAKSVAVVGGDAAPLGIVALTETGITAKPMGLADASGTLTLVATDPAGRRSAPATFSYRAMLPVMVVAFEATGGTKVGETFTGRFVPSVADRTGIAWTFSGLPEGLTGNAETGEVTGVIQQAGPFSFNGFAAKEGYRNGVGTGNVTFQHGQMTVSYSGDTTATYGRTVSGRFTADVEGATYEITGLPEGWIYDPTDGSFSGTVDSMDFIIVNATVTKDGYEEAHQSAAFAVQPATMTMWFSGSPSVDLSNGEYSGGFVAEGEEGALTDATFALAGGSLPPGLSLGPDGQVTGSPTASGTFSFTVKAARPGYRDVTQSQTIAVTKSDNTPPTMYSNTTAMAGSARLTFNFDEDVLIPSLAGFRVTSSGANMAVQSYTASGSQLVVNFTTAFVSGGTYQVHYDPAAAGSAITDLSGNEMAAVSNRSISVRSGGIQAPSNP